MKKLLLFVTIIVSSLSGIAQLTGTKTIPGDYADLQAAVTALNTQGVGAGGVNFTLGANQNLTATLQIGSATLNASTSATNPVIINGASFTINGAFVGTRTGTLTNNGNDALLALNGTDFVTIQNCVFTQQASNTTTTTAIENAIQIANRNGTTPFDGVQNLTVTGSTFSMGEIGTAGAAINAAAAVFGSTTALSWGTFAASPGDMHRDININNNTFTGYNFVNYYGATAVNGRKLFVNNNTINDIGGAAVAAYGLYGRYIDSCTFNNNTATLAATQSTTSYIAFLGTNAGGYQQANGNTITLQSASTTSQIAGLYYTSIGADREMNNNTIQFGSFSAITTGTVFGVFGSYSGANNNIVFSMNDNKCIGQNVFGSTATTATLHFFNNSASTGTGRVVEMKRNVIGNITRAGGGTTFAFNVGTANVVNVSANKIDNFSQNNSSTSSTGTFYGVYGNGSPLDQRIYDDTVTNVTISGTSTSTTGIFRGIHSLTIATGTGSIYENTVGSLSYGSGTNTGTVTGIYAGTAISHDIYRNKVYSLSSAQAAGIVRGIELVSGTTLSAYNNMVSDLQAPNSINTNAVSGILLSGGTTSNVLHNTIYPSSAGEITSSGTNIGGSGIYISSLTPAVTLQNNIVNISGAANGTGYFSAVKRVSGTSGTNPANLTMNNNIYNSSYIYGEGLLEASATNLYRYNSSASLGTDDPDFNTACGLFKTFKQDAGSFSEDNLAGSADIFAPAGSSFAEQGATTATSPLVTNDFAGVVRPAIPDIGALEFAGVLNDASGPTINYTDVPTQYCSSPATIVADITDPSNVNSTTAKPRLYFKKSTDSNAFNGNTNGNNGWKFVESASSTSPYSFTFNYSLLTSAAVPGNTIQYFIVAQDEFSTPNVRTNVGAYPSGFCPTSVNLPAGAFPITGTNQFVINPAPTVTVSASPLTVCANNNDTLSVSIAGIGTATVGSGTLTSTTTSPYLSSITNGRRVQYLYPASELIAQGLRAGDITALSFDVTSVATNPNDYTDWTLKIGATTATALTTSFSVTPSMTVFGPTNYTPTQGINTHTFTMPFTWDGTSNIVLEVCNAPLAVAGTSLSVRYQTASTASSIYTSVAAGCAATTGTATTNRPFVTFAGETSINNSILTYQWNDGVNPVGTSNDTIVVQPPFPSGNTMTYSVVATDASGCTYNGSVIITRNTTAPTGTIMVDKPSICFGDSVRLTSNISLGCAPYSYSWSDGVSVLSTASAFTAYPTANTTYTLTVTDNSGQIYSPASVLVTVNNPVITSSMGASRCGTGTVTLSATATAGNVVSWYSMSTGGAPQATGTSFTTPVIAATTSYYAAAATPQPNTTVTQGAGATTSATYSNPFYSLWSNIHTQHLITAAELNASGLMAGPISSVALDVTSAGTLPMIDLSVKLGATTATSMASFVPSAGLTTVYTNASLLPIVGVNTLTFTSAFMWDGTSNIVLEFCHGNSASSSTMSRTVKADVTSYVSTIKTNVNAATAAATICGDQTTNLLTYSTRPQFIFVGTGKCEGARTIVTATVTAAPTLSTIADETICNNESKLLNVVSTLSDFDGYSWSPIADLYLDAGGVTPYTGGNASSVYLKSATGGVRTIIVTGTNSTGAFCSNTDTVLVTILPASTIAASPATVCVSGSTTLSVIPSTGYGTGTLQWQVSPSGTAGTYTDISGATSITYITPVISSTSYYGLQIKDGAGNVCVLNPNVTVAVVSPSIVSTTSGSRCGPGSVTLGAAGSAGTSLFWFRGNNINDTTIGSGSAFMTPSISGTTNFYVSAGTSGGTSITARRASANPGTATVLSTYTMDFTVTENITLNEVDVFSTTGTALTVNLHSAGGTSILFTTGNVTTTTGVKNTISFGPSGWSIAPGTYRLGISGMTGNFYRENSGPVYPVALNSFTGPIGQVNGFTSAVTGSVTTSASWYFMYNWNITAGCNSAKSVVAASVNTPTGNLAGIVGGAQVCNTSTVPLPGETYYQIAGCNLINRVVPSGAAPINGSTSSCVIIETGTMVSASGKPYVMRHYDIEPTTNAAAATATITLYYLQSEFDNYNTYLTTNSLTQPPLPIGPADATGIGNLRVSQFHGTGTAPGNYTGTEEVLDPVDANIVWNATDSRWEVTFNVVGFSGFYAHTNLGALPVVISRIRGEVTGVSNTVYWTTESESNNKHFVVERSIDAVNFVAIGIVNSKANAGSSTSALNYAFVDLTPKQGKAYYRLSQVDLDNRARTSNTVEIKRAAAFAVAIDAVYPNPATDRINVVVTVPAKQNLSIIVSDLAGRTVSKKTLNVNDGSTNIPLDVRNLAKGGYFIRLVCDNGCDANAKFIKQ